MSRRNFISYSLAILYSSSIGMAAPAPKSPDRIDFDRQIRPILSDKCFACHGPDEKKRLANLRLDDRDGGAFEDRGDHWIIKPGDVAHSRLVQRITAAKPGMRMPPPGSGLSLTKEQTDLIVKWIEQGAEWRVHWAYVAPKRSPAPNVSNPAWVRNPIDAFVLARLDQEGLQPSPEADRITLLRRVTFDLTGLPPTLAEVDAFLADKSPDAYEKAVDRLLLSPRYGERMAMQWLDLARYSDTHGYHIDSHREMWHWRDWVIDAFNRNMPYDRFTVEQLAGDLLPDATVSQRIATGFNRNHMINFEGGAIPEEYQNEYVVDRLETTATTWLGLTMGCARCHDHKYDPISQKEFYQFSAFFNTVPEEGLDGRRGNAKPFLALPSPEQKFRLNALDESIAAREKILSDDIIAPLQTGWEPKRLAALSETPRAGLLAWYELDGNLSDITGHYRHGSVLKGDPSYAAGMIGNSAEFDGQTQVTFGPFDIESAKPFSIALWIAPGGARRNPLLTELTPDGGGFEIYLDDYVLTDIQQLSPRVFVRMGNRDKDGIELSASERLIEGEWYHFTLTYDGSGKAEGMKLFLNGRPAKTNVLRDTLAAAVKNVAPLEIGNAAFGPRFRGGLDDMRIYSRALAPEEIRILGVDEPVRAVLSKLPPSRSKEQRARLREFYLKNEAPDEYRSAWEELGTLKAENKALTAIIPTTMVMSEMAKPRETAVLARGDYRNRGEKVSPSTPAVLPPFPKDAPLNRLTLANWLVSPTHPLTARVAVNRFWQMYFGNGIVKTVQDFGSQGDPPTHPELLDWLATEFIGRGWDVRAMQRLIVTSATYRQSSRATPELIEKDPENRLLARGPRVRLPAEMVRDNALFVAGLLKERLGGPSVFPYQPPGLWEEVSFGDGFSAQTYTPSHGDDLYRRSMYTFWKRSSPPASLITFDAPDREKCTARRSVTNTPLQALVLLNDPTYLEAARTLAQKVITDAPRDASRRIELAFRLATARTPTKEESTLLRTLAAREMAEYKAHPDRARQLLDIGESKPDAKLQHVELAAWTTVASAILNLDETITKE
jgi:Protein of unknown function (DUF1553)/Protein of unknown function (DUF1549)/Concanavalin A-like lectin/glucanases superfamily/Planctomycete cytochrome C